MVSTILKNDGVRQWEGIIPNLLWKIKFMFQTTNQNLITLYYILMTRGSNFQLPLIDTWLFPATMSVSLLQQASGDFQP